VHSIVWWWQWSAIVDGCNRINYIIRRRAGTESERARVRKRERERGVGESEREGWCKNHESELASWDV
jgi:hypothetical protein